VTSTVLYFRSSCPDALRAEARFAQCDPIGSRFEVGVDGPRRARAGFDRAALVLELEQDFRNGDIPLIADITH
jgi:hypothetical protein